MLKNEYLALKRENDLTASTLRGENQLTLRDLCDMLETLTWDNYEIQRVRKDLIAIAARCEVEGHTLQQEIGGDPDAFLLALAPGLHRGTPLDSVCTWYPHTYLLFAALNLVGFLLTGRTAMVDLIQILLSPFFFLVLLYAGSWLWGLALRTKARRGRRAALPLGLLALAFYLVFCFAYYQVILLLPDVPVNALFEVFYYLLVAAAAKFWQVVHYNRCAARHPWQEAPHP